MTVWLLSGARLDAVSLAETGLQNVAEPSAPILRAWGLGFRVWGIKLRGLGFRVLGFRVQGLEFRV